MEQEKQERIFDPGFAERLADQIEAQVAQHLEGLHIEERVRAKIEAAMAKLERKIAKAKRRALRAQAKRHKAEEKAKRAAERATRRVEHKKAEARPTPPAAPPPASASEEQLAILDMLRQQKITADQADLLLKALDQPES